MIFRLDGWQKYSIWDHSATVRNLYERRCRLQVEEMTAHQQAALLLQPMVAEGDSLLDVGCGSGYFFHALRRQDVSVEYYGVDASKILIEIGKRWMPEHGLDPERLIIARIEDLDMQVDHVVCMNVLSNIDNYHRPLERLLTCAKKTLILRESLGGQNDYKYVVDKYLDDGIPLKVYVNTYAIREVMSFIEGYGFSVRSIIDSRTGGTPEMVIDYPHFWTFLVAERKD
jgi:SAM-dependent methyltransferase